MCLISRVVDGVKKLTSHAVHIARAHVCVCVRLYVSVRYVLLDCT